MADVRASLIAVMLEAFGEPTGQAGTQLVELAVAFVLSAVIGLERELKQKSAGVRTYTVVGFASALWMLVSKYGFSDVLVNGTVVVDPSRVAAQIVAGVGFIGGGIIFVKRDSVRGLTTAAGIFLTAAIGACAGSGLILLATVATVGYFIAVFIHTPLARFAHRHVETLPPLRVHFVDGQRLLHRVVYVSGIGDLHAVVAELSELDGILSISTVDEESETY